MCTPFVTHTVTAYNQAPYLEGLVRRILAQSISPIEIVFADDGSQDGSVGRVAAGNHWRHSLRRRIGPGDRAKMNRGSSLAINCGAEDAKGS